MVVGTRRLLSRPVAARCWDLVERCQGRHVLLVLGAASWFAWVGPLSYHAQWRERATRALADIEPGASDVTEGDLNALPEPLAAYVRQSGAVGSPRVKSLQAEIHGRIRSGPDSVWMPFTGKQVNTYGPSPQRAFIIDASKSGLPVTVLHLYDHATATMRAKALSVATVVDASGPEMDRGETVTVFNDLVVMAPGAIVDAPVRWTAIDAEHVRGVYTDGEPTVSAVLTFNTEHDLVDFVSQDRFRASADGQSFDRQGWSTPSLAYRDTAGFRLPGW